MYSTNSPVDRAVASHAGDRFAIAGCDTGRDTGSDRSTDKRSATGVNVMVPRKLPHQQMFRVTVVKYLPLNGHECQV